SLCSIKTRQQLSSVRTCPRATFARLCRSTVNSPSSPWAPPAFGSPKSEGRRSFSAWSHSQRWWIVPGLGTSLPAAFWRLGYAKSLRTARPGATLPPRQCSRSLAQTLARKDGIDSARAAPKRRQNTFR
ncbi:unnamed protein product, partial [Symbiodinium sp. CCMP2456]